MSRARDAVGRRRPRPRSVVAALGCVVVLAAGCADDEGVADDGVRIGAAPTSAEQPDGPTARATVTDDRDPERDTVAVSTLDGEGCPDETRGADFPDVVGATFTPVAGDPPRWQVSVTLCSLYDTPERYADAWRVRSPDGDVLGVRVLLHDHAAEQPFTRSLGEPVTVPEGVATVVVEGRDLVNGWGGATLDVELGR